MHKVFLYVICYEYRVFAIDDAEDIWMLSFHHDDLPLLQRISPTDPYHVNVIRVLKSMVALNG